MADKRYNIWWSVSWTNCGLSKRAKRTAGTGRKAPFGTISRLRIGKGCPPLYRTP
uniref:Uncharacterized protein n=1 Tax=virus sp. ctQmo6 TaxID=2827990 RepID=A0A8S5RFC0_9VIRU|nr:MAG TPA: hypothetical protein [virus sp. ctQmo6]